ncbi:MAG: bifunctional adenosylcobinamide kinase/adenosylcobinamide-phosphate guanylyltransferase [Sedimenticola sp.]|nr:bifunctional adenosylcobinamide kinase/adenosylcobinamide-phosphate guanylyltransferase [Sedimenticola sp.]
MQQLILGGARSGKSRLAERLACESGGEVVYVATAGWHADDPEMGLRIEQHRQRRPAQWLLVEEPLHLARALQRYQADGRCLIVDCLTLWLSNLLLSDDAAHFESESEALLNLLPDIECDLILVANEVGMGIVPMGALSRRFQDESGWMQQRVAALVDRVVLTVAGLPLTLKGDRL